MSLKEHFDKTNWLGVSSQFKVTLILTLTLTVLYIITFQHNGKAIMVWKILAPCYIKSLYFLTLFLQEWPWAFYEPQIHLKLKMWKCCFCRLANLALPCDPDSHPWICFTPLNLWYAWSSVRVYTHINLLRAAHVFKWGCSVRNLIWTARSLCTGINMCNKSLMVQFIHLSSMFLMH
jgi:hypothetical protein